MDFLQFFYDDKHRFFYEKTSGNLGISSETTIPGISSETTIPGGPCEGLRSTCDALRSLAEPLLTEHLRSSCEALVEPLRSRCGATVEPLWHHGGSFFVQPSLWRLLSGASSQEPSSWSFHSRSPGRFTRDSQVVSLVIPRFTAHFFRKKSFFFLS